MSEPYIIFNGVDSRAMGVVIEQLPDFHRPARRVEQTDIPGSSMPVIVDEGGYDSYQTQLIVNAMGGSLRTLYNWLRGEGWLISSDEPDYKAWVHMYAQITDSRFRVEEGCYDSITVQLTVLPYLREVEEESVPLTAAGSFAGKGSDSAQPILAIEGEGDVTVTINGVPVLVSGLEGTIYLDCEAGIAYTEADGAREWAGGMVTLTDGWPELLPAGGTNAVTWEGSVSSVTIQPQWRYL